MHLWRLLSTCTFVRRLFRNIEQVQKLSELGVLFLLFEMGLELSLDRLKVKIASHSRILNSTLPSARAFCCGLFPSVLLAAYKKWCVHGRHICNKIIHPVSHLDWDSIFTDSGKSHFIFQAESGCLLHLGQSPRLGTGL